MIPRSQPRVCLPLLCAVAALIWAGQGCVRSGSATTSGDQASSNRQTLPFHPEGSTTPPSEIDPAVSSSMKPANAVPFRSGSRFTLAEGTLVTVELTDTLSSRKTHVGDEFNVALASPLKAEHDVLVDRGTPAKGRVEFIQPGSGARSPGYFRLTLNAIDATSGSVPIQTASLFARSAVAQRSLSNASASSRPPLALVPKGRKLTFRLTAPLTLEPANLSISASKSSGQ